MHKARTVMAANDGLLTRSQALDAGLSPCDPEPDPSGALVLLRRGVYVDGELWKSLDVYRGQHRLRTRAALKTMRRAWVVSHDSAGHEHELDLLIPPKPHVHITRPGFTTAWTKHGVKHHLAPFREEQVQQVNGLPVLDMARTAVDIAREHGTALRRGRLRLCDAQGVTRAALEAASNRCATGPMSTNPSRRCIRRSASWKRRGDARPRTRVRLVAMLGLALQVETPVPGATEHGRVAWCDIGLGCHVFEVDGKLKYVPVEEGGLAEKPAHEVVWAEKKRERDLHQVRLGTSRIFWEDYWPPQRATSLRRMRDEYEDTRARFGDVLPEYLVRQPGTTW